jgi:hypothetical protein
MGLFTKKNKNEEIKKPFSVTPRVSELPEISDLPKLPELPSLDEEEYSDEAIPKLPSFPTNTLGTKFSQNTIKEAVSGKKEAVGVFDADDFSEEEDSEIMHKPLKPIREEVESYDQGETMKRLPKPTTYDQKETMRMPVRQMAYDEGEIMTKSIKSNVREEEPAAYEENFSLMPARSREISSSKMGYRERTSGAKKTEPVFVRLDKFEEGMNLFDDIKAQIADMEHLIRNTHEIKQKEEEELNSWQNQLQEVKRQIEKVDKDIFSKIE